SQPEHVRGESEDGVRPLSDEPHPSRLSTDHPKRDEIIAAHHQSLKEGRNGYTDPVSGYFVFTSAYLGARGTCCDSGCRHCPYVE
ncbi:MAG: DUF5522 domain-containing protein, partial [Acidimicrobiales bacterium]